MTKSGMKDSGSVRPDSSPLLLSNSISSLGRWSCNDLNKLVSRLIQMVISDFDSKYYDYSKTIENVIVD